MSQYPQVPSGPYGAPDPSQGGAAPSWYYPADPYAAWLKPNRRAGVLMFVLGGLLMLCSVVNVAGVWLVDPDQLLAQQQGMLPAGMEGPQLSGGAMRLLVTVIYSLAALSGLLLVALGVPVRRGSMGATGTAVGIAGVALLVLALGVLASVVAMVGGAGVIGAMSLCIVGLPAALFAVLMLWLVQSIGAIGRLRTAQVQYQQQAQYWQHQQGQQQGGNPPAGGGWYHGGPSA